ncbi:MAG TPA: peroxiredoxin-like family protein [Lacunisphaera sp.]|jgi:peroxiredoxin|nr:peroxiredoxin-like family protein [Lacunisphaera sp.]
MHLRSFRLFIVLLSLPLALRAGLAPAATAIAPIAPGVKAPAATVQTVAGAGIELASVLAAKPTVLVFYRGSWCPYCNRHLAALAEVEPKLLELGYQIVAISPDETAGLQAMAAKHHLAYRLLSDRAMTAASAFGVAFRVDAAGVAAYRGYGVELPPVPGEADARWLPVPSVFIIDRAGVVRFAHTNPDFKVRLSGEEVLAAAQAAR